LIRQQATAADSHDILRRPVLLAGTDPRRIHSIARAQRSITAETALLLGRFFGNSAGFWMGFQSQYDLEVAQDRLTERLDEITVHAP